MTSDEAWEQLIEALRAAKAHVTLYGKTLTDFRDPPAAASPPVEPGTPHEKKPPPPGRTVEAGARHDSEALTESNGPFAAHKERSTCLGSSGQDTIPVPPAPPREGGR